jgi:uncharacterized membrane protein YsdA (DUF1294 family)
MLYEFTLIYLAVISLLAIGITLFDKRAARKNARRVKERTLLFVAALGGSVAMLVTMRMIRHKTKHLKFMLGIPVIIVLQIAAALLIWWFIK